MAHAPRQARRNDFRLPDTIGVDIEYPRPPAPVERLALGLGTIVTDGYGAKNPDGFAELLIGAAEAGITRLDTAAAYGAGESESLVGRWSNELDLSFSICTKIGLLPAPDHGGFMSDASPDSLMRQAEASLKRLGIDRVDILLLHRPDPDISAQISVEGMIACREAGLAAKIGISNVPDEVALELIDDGLIDVIQYPWSLLDVRRVGLLREAGDKGVERMVFGTLAFGILAGSVRDDTLFDEDDWRGIARSGRDPGTNGAPLFMGRRFDAAMSRAAEFANMSGTNLDRLGEATIAASLALAPAERVIVGCRSARELAGLVSGCERKLPSHAVAYASDMSVI